MREQGLTNAAFQQHPWFQEETTSNPISGLTYLTIQLTRQLQGVDSEASGAVQGAQPACRPAAQLSPLQLKFNRQPVFVLVFGV